MRSFVLYALAAVARAAPQKTVMPVRPGFVNATATATTAFPSKPTGLSCQADCEVRYPELQAVSWVRKDQIDYFTTITAGTVSIVTIVSGNQTLQTRTATVPGYIPPEYDLWRPTSTNEAGTAYIVVSTSLSALDIYSWYTVTYPTPYLDYPDAYHWSGTLSTSSACVTATELQFGELTAHPEYYQPKTATPYENDYVGAEYTPVRVPAQEYPDKAWFDNKFPSEPAFMSCSPVQGKRPGSDVYAPKFVWDTTSLIQTTSSQPAVHVQSSTSGFESISRPGITFQIPPPLKSESGFEGSTSVPAASPPPGLTTLFLPPPPGSTNNAQAPASSSVNDVKGPNPSSVNNANVPDPPEITPPPAPPVPIYTPSPTGSVLIPTIIDGRPTASPGYVVPGSRETASIGQTITVDGRPTVVAPPPASFTVIPTTINGVATSVPAYIVAGTSTASIGQPVNINGQSTVLSAPPPLFTMLPTTINGQATSVPGYIISGATTATLGQTVSVNGASTVLSAPAPYLTMIPTTINGVATSVPAYIISGTSTASPGQTVTINGKTSVLPNADVAITYIPTTINGVVTSVPAYIISGTSTAFPGQTITINGQTTVLPSADVVRTYIQTTINGVATSVLAYIISGTSTAFPGQIITLNGKPAVLPDPDVVLTSITTSILGHMTVIPVYIISGSITATLGQVVTLAGKTTVLPSITTTSSGSEASSLFGGPASTAFGGARETGKKQGSGETQRVSFGILLGGIACALLC